MTARLTHADIGQDLTWDEYVAIDAENHSALKALDEDNDGSPLAYQWRKQQPQPDKDAFRKGRALHTAVLEPARLPLDLAIWRGGRRGTNAYKAWKAEHAERTELSVAEYDQTQQQAEAVCTHPLVIPYLRSYVAERTLVWEDRATGLMCKRRTDGLTTAHEGAALTVLELKTAREINARRFSQAIHNYGYATAAAHTTAGLMALTGLASHQIRHVFLVVKSAPPFDVAVYELDAMSLDVAADKVAGWLETVKHCRETGQWPGMFREEQVVSLPTYAMPDPDEALTWSE